MPERQRAGYLNRVILAIANIVIFDFFIISYCLFMKIK